MQFYFMEYVGNLIYKCQFNNTGETFSLPTCPLREKKSFSQRVFSIYMDIRKLQDKAKTSYTLTVSERCQSSIPCQTNCVS